VIETEEERRLFQKGEENYNAKKALRKTSLLQQAPDDEEGDLIHAMWTTEMSYLSETDIILPIIYCIVF
jgi:acyl-coenzyme A thioesterase 9